MSSLFGKMLIVVIVVAMTIERLMSERCPPIIGEFECPLGTFCMNNNCEDGRGGPAALACDNVYCPDMSRCYKGRCYPTIGLTCNRNVLVANNTATAIVSDCGSQGKCLNGRCVHDRCLNVECSETQLCIDGKCEEMLDKFCLSSFDCGPLMECEANKCAPFGYTTLCSCDPGEYCQNGACLPDPECLNQLCPAGLYCIRGQCVSALGMDCTQYVCPVGTECAHGRCEIDQCINRCPVDNDCRGGECRHLQGLLCKNHCPSPYECIDGRCTRNDCSIKTCQLQESCEFGICLKIEGRLCSLAIRDCAQDYECEANLCREQLKPLISKRSPAPNVPILNQTTNLSADIVEPFSNVEPNFTHSSSEISSNFSIDSTANHAESHDEQPLIFQFPFSTAPYSRPLPSVMRNMTEALMMNDIKFP